jgi:hypothetical protein
MKLWNANDVDGWRDASGEKSMVLRVKEQVCQSGSHVVKEQSDPF